MEQRVTGSVIKMQTKVTGDGIYMQLYIVFMDFWNKMYSIEREIVHDQQSSTKVDLLI